MNVINMEKSSEYSHCFLNMKELTMEGSPVNV